LRTSDVNQYEDLSPAPHPAKLITHRRMAVGVILTGIALGLLIGIIEDEPTIPPLVLFFAGVVWFVRTHLKLRAESTQEGH